MTTQFFSKKFHCSLLSICIHVLQHHKVHLEHLLPAPWTKLKRFC